jgi:hypothetical protein
MAFELRRQRSDEAVLVLIAARCYNLIGKADSKNVAPPSRSWVNFFATNHGFELKNVRRVDPLRIAAATTEKVGAFFDEFQDLISRYPPELIFGADETMIDLHRVYKCIINPEYRNVQTEPATLPHISAMLAHCCSGMRLPPFVIIPEQKKPTPDIIDVMRSRDFWLCAGQNGWQTRSTFFIWAAYFCHWSTLYWHYLTEPWMQEGSILLIVDGHTSRACPAALDLFIMFHIDVLVLPSHTSHVMQMFDIGLAAVFKQNVATYFRRIHHSLTKYPCKVASLRYAAIAASINAWNTTASAEACRQSAVSAGLCPLDRNAVLRNRLVNDHVPDNLDLPGHPRNLLNINARIITSPDVLEEIRNDIRSRDPNFPFLEFRSNVPYITQLFRLFALADCVLFSEIIDFVFLPFMNIWAPEQGGKCAVREEFSRIGRPGISRFSHNSFLNADLFISQNGPDAALPVVIVEKNDMDPLYEVFKCFNLQTGKVYCLKTLKSHAMEMDFVIQGVRDCIGKLCVLSGPKAEELVQIICESLGRIHFLHSYYNFNLETVVFALHISFSVPQLSMILKGMILCLEWLQSIDYVHTDLRLNHFLFSEISDIRLGGLCHALKVVDFPLFDRTLSDITRLPPEFILGDRTNWRGFVVWTFACVLFQLLTGTALFDGWRSPSNQIWRILQVCGTPDANVLRFWRHLPHRNLLPDDFEVPNPEIETLLLLLPDETNMREVLRGMLALDPGARWSLSLCRKHGLFSMPLEEISTEEFDVMKTIAECPSMYSFNQRRERTTPVRPNVQINRRAPRPRPPRVV